MKIKALCQISFCSFKIPVAILQLDFHSSTSDFKLPAGSAE